jgi:hypothetical protein
MMPVRPPWQKVFGWFRVHNDFCGHRKWRLAARKTGLSLGNVEALVLRLLTCGNKSKPRGWARAKNGIPSVHPLTSRYPALSGVTVREFGN